MMMIITTGPTKGVIREKVNTRDACESATDA